MTLAEKRVEFTELVNHLSLWLTSEGIRHAFDWCKRDIKTQAEPVNSGASQTIKSKHLEALAMDFIIYDELDKYITDGDHPYYKLMGKRAKELGLTWGGDWGWDASHVEYKEG